MIEASLRPYQQEIINQVFELWKQGKKRLLVQAPTGSGKSLIIARICLEFFLRNQPIVIVAHKIELINQLHDHVFRWLGYKPGIFANKSQYPRDLSRLIQVVSIQALALQEDSQWPAAALVVIDEAHHSTSNTYSKLFDNYPDAHFVGLTATPKRLDGKGFREIGKNGLGFEELILGPAVRDLIGDGYLCPYKIFAAPVLVDPRGKIKAKGGDYDAIALDRFVSESVLAGDVVGQWEKLGQGKRTVLYPTSVERSMEYCREFQLRGYPAAHIDANTPPRERERIIADFAEGNILVLCQHSIVIEGVDIPGIEVVQFVRPTRSLTIWFQAIGRALRPAEGKSHAIIIDHTTNHLSLPWVDHPVNWSLESEERLQQLAEEQRRLAQEQNQNEFYQSREIGTDSSIELVEVKGLDFSFLERLEQLNNLATRNGYKKAWIGYRLLEEYPDITLPQLYKVAAILGYQKGWAYHRYQELIKGRKQSA